MDQGATNDSQSVPNLYYFESGVTEKQTQDESDKWVLIVQRDNLESHGQIPSQTCNTTSGLLV